MVDPSKWRWFCGNDTSLDTFTWTAKNIVSNFCVLDGLSSALQTFFLVLFVSTLLILKCCSKFRTINTPYLMRYPGHFIRWLVSSFLLLVLVASMGEGALTSQSYEWDGIPHMIISPAVCFVSVLATLIVNQSMEVWHQPKLSWLLLIYWLGSVAMETGQLMGLIENDMVDVEIVRFDVTIGRLTLLVILTLIEMNVIRVKVFRCCYDPKSNAFPRDLRSSTMRNYHKYSNAFSSGVFHWLQPLLKIGSQRPIEMEDIGTLPQEQRARACYEEFRESFLVEKEKALYRGKKPSLWKVCAKVSGGQLALAISLRLVADTLAYVGPLVIAGITTYAADMNEEKNKDGHFVKISEYFADGYVLLITAFLCFAVKGLVQANTVYIQQIQGIKIKTALQALVYEKSLRLSQYLTTSGTMTMGQISNHMAVDSMQGFWISVVGHFTVTTPFNLVVTLVLLYLQMGYAALVGAGVIVIIFPFQMKVAKTIVVYQKKMLKFSDQRLKQSNELLQGIKLLKLYGWEELYELAIEAVRHQELKCLAKLLACTAITIGFTSVAPILMTLVAFTTYPALSGKDLQPAVAFSSLSLFNLLMVPLFSLPLTISTLVNSIVSFKRLGAFLTATEVHEDEENKNWQEADIDEGQDYFDDKSLEDVAARNPNGYTLLFNDPANREANIRSNLLSASPNHTTYGAVDATGGLTASLKDNGVALMRPRTPLPDAVAIKLEDGCFTWDQDSLDPILSNINVEIPAGKLTMIVGQVGVGKSSLLSAMLGEMVVTNGYVQFNGFELQYGVGPIGRLLEVGALMTIWTLIASAQVHKFTRGIFIIRADVINVPEEKSRVAYAAQKAWLCNSTLKDNILFGQPMDEARYKQVLAACALEPDIDILPAGDMTEIGEKGINLSGGQKQRVSVARAMYAARDIVILDDPLSALDVHVGGHLFQEGIVGMLLKQRQTVILVTHQLQYLEFADKILVLKDGRITCEGTVYEVTQSDPDLHHSWRTSLHLGTESESASEMSEQESQSEAEREDLRKQVRKKVIGAKVAEEKVDITSTKGKLIEEEEMERGSVSYRVYFFYLHNVGWFTLCAALFLFMCQTALQTYNGFWLADWSEAGLNSTNETVSATYYIKGYAYLQGALMAVCLGSLSLITVAAFTASKNLHYGMLRNIIRAPVRFFDTTPVGRILNRMSSDQQLIDMRMCQTIFVLLNGLFLCISGLLVNAIITPWFIGLAIPMIVIYFYMQSYYLKSTRELQRLDSVTKSPVFAFFSETLTGLETIRAYKEQNRFFRTFLERLDTNIIPFMYLRVIMAWLAVRLDFVGAFIVLLAGGSALIGASIGGVQSSFVGLALSLALSIAGYLNFLVQSASNMEIMMNAVERVKHYTGIENEDYEGMMPPRTWPQYGEISIEGISARYAADLDPVLKQVSVFIKAGDKVGICGRTGSGKSSLTLSLFRIIDMFEGHIIIDDVDIASVPLATLRQKLSIIPQDPILFTGSIRQNLDPEGHRSDGELWEAVEIAQLKDIVQGLPEGLDFMVTEGGENFSMGQRQLFCLARAFLRKSRVLIMDEATASIDMQTDKMLQKVVATAFADRTVLTIAHRVTTILNSDTILVLNEGEIVEHDSPQNLLAKEGSIFADFVKAKK